MRAKILKDLKRRKSPMLITPDARPLAYLMDVNSYERLRILEGVARGEEAILESRIVSHPVAKRRMKRWLN